LGKFSSIRFLTARDHSKRNWQIEARPLLSNVSRREIHRRASARPVISAVRNRSGDAILTFLHRRIGQSDDHDGRQSAGRVHLDLDFVGINAKDGGRINFREHLGRGWQRKFRGKRGKSSQIKSDRKIGPIEGKEKQMPNAEHSTLTPKARHSSNA